jgi:ketopantoate reductase
MALGAVYFGTAVVDANVIEIYDRPECRRVLAALCGEVVAVADALGIDIKSSDGFDPKAFRNGGTDEAEMTASWEAQRAYWNAHDNKVTGVWRDLAIFKRPTEVDSQITPVIAMAKDNGVPVPHLERLRDTVKAIESGMVPQSFDALESIGAGSGSISA